MLTYVRGRDRDTRKRNYVNRREEGKSRSHLPLTTDIHHTVEWMEPVERIGYCPVLDQDTHNPIDFVNTRYLSKDVSCTVPRSLSTIDRPMYLAVIVKLDEAKVNSV